MALLCIRSLMIRICTIALVFAFVLVPALKVTAQDVAEQMRQARQLELAFKDAEALQKYLAVIRTEPNNVQALCKASELYNLIGKRLSTKQQQRDYYRKARELAERALKLNPNSSEANFVMAVAMGRMALIASGEEKINAVKDIKNYAERSIQLDPTNFKSYHVLGKWYLEVSDLSSVERWLVKVTYGALPKATIDDAIRYYYKSYNLNPKFLLNYLELAKAYQKKNEPEKAVSMLNNMLKLPPSSSDDPHIQGEGKKMLESLR